MASQNPIQTFKTPSPVARPRAKPLATRLRSVGYESSSGLSDHSGRQGKIISITPSVAHKNTKSKTPMRCNHKRIPDGEGLETAAAPNGAGASGDSVAKGSLGSEIIARVVLNKAAGRARK